MERTGEGVIHWLERRVIPKNRAFVDEILKTLGLGHNDTKGIIDVCKGLSLNDSYWVVPEGFEGKFFQYNLYENRFSEILALVAYTGAGGSRQAFTTSPELTTGGMLPKAWRYVDHDGIYLYKGGTTGASNAGREPYCEYYASQLSLIHIFLFGGHGNYLRKGCHPAAFLCASAEGGKAQAPASAPGRPG